ncbi:S-adenosyl-L-methionine-dependent methyltransferase-like [Lasallia pustulata]|uniref:protein-histidine N-methyltransferase n=1 Tax=Lasallia pustulata TaxID=136370 RepID=A0A1W5DCT1_9LECA|nr:S-adenosyl-L-methionine-dependent methyltransferase-like [Lasallia pustulata]
MAQAFSFGFNSDDIDDDNDNEHVMDVERPPNTSEPAEHVELKPVPPRRHTLLELLSSLPSKISYSTIHIPADHGRSIRLPRRDLFDIRAQIMAEDTGDDPTLTAGLAPNDIHPLVYEGGFKTWECSLDLSRHLLSEYADSTPASKHGVHVIELGAGTALPTLTLLSLLLSHPPAPPVHLTLTDYNPHVLRLSSLPNLLLAWASHTHLLPAAEGDLDTPPALRDAFLRDLHARGIVVDAVSGAWGGDFVRLRDGLCAAQYGGVRGDGAGAAGAPGGALGADRFGG